MAPESPAALTTVHIDFAERGLPLADAIRELELHFGRIITYEDAASLAPADVVEQVRRDGKAGPRVLGRRLSGLIFDYAPTETLPERRVEEALSQLIATWSRSNPPGEVKVVPTTGGLHVIPVARRGRDGRMEPYISPLEARITVPFEERGAVSTIEIIAKAVSSVIGRNIDLGMIPRGFERLKTKLGAEDLIAREVLWSALQDIDRSLSFELLCGVEVDSTCLINIHVVRWKAD